MEADREPIVKLISNILNTDEKSIKNHLFD